MDRGSGRAEREGQAGLPLKRAGREERAGRMAGRPKNSRSAGAGGGGGGKKAGKMKGVVGNECKKRRNLRED